MLTASYIYIKIIVNMKHKNRKRLDLRTEKDISGYTMEELAKIVLKNKMFTFNLKIYRQKRSTAIGTKFSQAYSILFMSDLEERIPKNLHLKPYLWRRYIDDIFFRWQHR